MKKGAVDYRVYKLSAKEILGYGIIFMCCAALAGWLLFARVWLGLLIGAVLLPLFYKKLKGYLKDKRKARLEEEFCRFMQLTASSLSGGTAFENVFREVADAVSQENSGQSLMEKEFYIIDRLIGLNYESTAAFEKFADRTGSRDIKSISEAIRSVASTGGDLSELLKGGVNALRLKQDTEREIRRTVALPKMNHRILTCMPFGFILLLRYMSPTYIECLYEGIGIFIMSSVALLIGLAWLLGDKAGKIHI